MQEPQHQNMGMDKCTLENMLRYDLLPSPTGFIFSTHMHTMINLKKTECKITTAVFTKVLIDGCRDRHIFARYFIFYQFSSSNNKKNWRWSTVKWRIQQICMCGRHKEYTFAVRASFPISHILLPKSITVKSLMKVNFKFWVLLSTSVVQTCIYG